MADGRAQVTQYFPASERCPPFKWKDYSPQVFQRLRAIFGINSKARRMRPERAPGGWIQLSAAVLLSCDAGRAS